MLTLIVAVSFLRLSWGHSGLLCVHCSAIHLPDKFEYIRLSLGIEVNSVRVFSCTGCSCTIKMYVAECPQPGKLKNMSRSVFIQDLDMVLPVPLSMSSFCERGARMYHLKIYRMQGKAASAVQAVTD